MSTEPERAETVVGFAPLANPDSVDPVVPGRLSDEAADVLSGLARPTGPIPRGRSEVASADRWARHVDVDRRNGTVNASFWWRPVDLADGAFRGLRSEIRSFVERANLGLFRFVLTEIDASDPMVLLRFEHGDRRRPTMDLSAAHSRRKLTVLIPLSARPDREGGDLLFPGVPVQADQEPAHVTTMPAWVEWGVTPIESGSAVVAVCWAHGRPFR